jgi:hypothetical protein
MDAFKFSYFVNSNLGKFKSFVWFDFGNKKMKIQNDQWLGMSSLMKPK